MEISEQLRCLYTAKLQERDGSYVLEVPDREVQLGELQQGETYRVALLPVANGERTQPDRGREDGHERDRAQPEPPVEEGETRVVEIEAIGDQGDGITRVERGFVVIVPDTEQGERVKIEITEVQQNVAFAEVTERVSYYE